MDATGLLLIFLTGIVVIVLSYTLDHIWAAALPARVLYIFIRLPGVVLHECAHIVGCLLTGARIGKVVLFSQNGGSVTHARPALPFIGDVIISSAPLFLLPLALSFISWIFGTYLGCIFPAFPIRLDSLGVLMNLGKAILSSFTDNLLTRFNGWFLLYLYLTLSLVLSASPSRQDMKNAAAGCIILILVGMLIFWSGVPGAVFALEELVRLLGYGLTLGLVYGLIALAASLPLLVWYGFAHRS